MACNRSRIDFYNYNEIMLSVLGSIASAALPALTSWFAKKVGGGRLGSKAAAFVNNPLVSKTFKRIKQDLNTKP